MTYYFIKKLSDNLYEVEDNKSAILHYFALEIDSLKLKSPVRFNITVRPSDRIGYRKKLVNLFKKINKQSYYEVEVSYES